MHTKSPVAMTTTPYFSKVKFHCKITWEYCSRTITTLYASESHLYILRCEEHIQVHLSPKPSNPLNTLDLLMQHSTETHITQILLNCLSLKRYTYRHLGFLFEEISVSWRKTNKKENTLFCLNVGFGVSNLSSEEIAFTWRDWGTAHSK